MYALNLASAEKQYEKDKTLQKTDVEALFDWLKKQPHLPKLTELQVILFLQSCYYSMESAKAAIDEYFTMRTHLPYIFEQADEQVIRQTLDAEYIQIFPKKTPEGYMILLMKLRDLRPEKYVSLNSLKLAIMVITLYLHQHGPQEGFILMTDTKGATLSHMARANLTAVKHALHFGQEALPIRIKGLHYVNITPLTEKLISFVKPFIKKDILSLINIHSSFDSLYKCIPKESLPEDYGGYMPSLQKLHEENLQNLLSNIDFFKWHDGQKVDESKRINKASTNTNFGIEGSFKKLELD